MRPWARETLKSRLLSTAVLVPVGMGLMLVLNVVAARAVGPEIFGEFAIALTVAPMVALLATSGAPPAAMRFIAQYLQANEAALARGAIVWSLRVSAVAGMISCIALAAALQLDFLPDLGKNWLSASLLVVPMSLWVWQRFVCLGLGATSLALVPRDVALPLVATGCILLLNQLAVPLPHPLSIYLACLSVIMLVATAQTLVMARRRVGVNSLFRRKEWRRSSAPMLLNSIAQLGLNRWDIVIVGALLSAHDAGIYAAASQMALIVTPVSRVVITFSAPVFAAAYNNGDRAKVVELMRRSVWGLAICGLGMVIAAMTLATWAIQALYGAEFSAAVPLFTVLLVGQLAGVLASPASTLLWMGAGERSQAAINLLTAAAVVIGCIIVVPTHGAVGAAYVTASSIGIGSIIMAVKAARVLSRMPRVEKGVEVR